MNVIGSSRWARRSVTSAVLALGVAAALGAAGSDPAVAQDRVAQAKAEGKVVLFSGQSNEILERLKKAFEARYPGVTLDYLRADVSPMIQRFVTETAAGRRTADVLDIVERRSVELAEKGLAASYVSPEAASLPEEAKVKDGMWSNYLLHLGSFAYNTARVKEPPQSWDDLLDPKWKGRIGIQNPVQGGGAAIWVITMYEAWGEAKWLDYMTRLAAQQPRLGNYLQVQDMLAGGEVDIHVVAYPNYVEPFRVRTKAPVEWAAPNPTMRTFHTLTIAKNSPSPNAARLLVDYLLSSEGQTLMAELQLLPVKEQSRPAAYAKLNNVTFHDQAWRLELTKPDWFRDKIREIFTPK